ncbi:MAG: hypothetical protein E7328_04645 [Clostridiales bacterium]|nr:hypothetical protein [Clostridiales bacterium]
MKQLSRRVKVGVTALLWGGICAMAGGAVGYHMAPDAVSAPYYANQYTLDLAQTLEEGMWQWESVTIRFEDGVMALSPVDGQAVLAGGEQGAQSGRLTVHQYLGGTPKEGVRFTVLRGDGTPCANLTTDASGTATVLLGVGEYRLTRGTEDALQTDEMDHPFTIHKGEDLHLRMCEPALGTLAISGSPGAEVRVYRGSGSRSALAAQVTVGQAGTAMVDALAPGEYTVLWDGGERQVMVYGGMEQRLELQ